MYMVDEKGTEAHVLQGDVEGTDTARQSHDWPHVMLVLVTVWMED